MTRRPGDDLQSRIYHKLLDVVPDLLTIEEHGKSVVENTMDLNLDVLQRTPTKIVIALSHYWKHPSGDMIPDPDMVLAVYPGLEQAEALSYQDFYGYQEVYQQEMGRVDTRAKHSLNAFLNTWLRNLILQGHQILADDGQDRPEDASNLHPT